MIRFFRKFKLHSLSAKKFKSYFFYAVGEILLIVLGILIALQINNWNNKRIKLEQGHLLLMELVEETKTDLNTCNWAIKHLKICIKQNEDIFKIENLDKVSLDSLSFFFSDANLDIKITSNTYDKMKSLGISNISVNDELNKAINNYFDGDVVKFNRRIAYYWDNQRERWDYFANQNVFNFNSELIKGFDPIAQEETKNKMIEFINLPRTRTSIEATYQQSVEALNTIESFKEKAILLLEQIHSELKKTNPDLEPLPNFDTG